MSREHFQLDELVPAAEPPEKVAFGSPDVVEPLTTLRCSICGAPHSEVSLPIRYANPVCDACDQLAVNSEGADPWHGWPPGEAPESEPGTIQLAPDHGENPVFIAGVKCWRRYRFGGWITRRDAFDCDSLEEFREQHRHEETVMYAFNTPQPDGVDVPQEQCREAVQRRNTIQSLFEDARDIADGDQSVSSRVELAERVQAVDLSLPTESSPPTEMTPQEYALKVAIAAERALQDETEFASLCRRYYGDTLEDYDNGS